MRGGHHLATHDAHSAHNCSISFTGRWWGPAEAHVTQIDAPRVETARSICANAPLRVLELGSGYGTTAVAAADAGYGVTA
ncbi:MAG: hypothetical protein ACOYNI_08035 [Acidimicrobiia bacterium]